jgi:hypothetical protein
MSGAKLPGLEVLLQALKNKTQTLNPFFYAVEGWQAGREKLWGVEAFVRWLVTNFRVQFYWGALHPGRYFPRY